MLKKFISLLLIAIMLLSMVACTSTQGPGTTPTEPSTEATEQTLNGTEPSAENTNIDMNAYDTLTQSEYAAHILDKAYGATNENTMFSPLSLNMALGLIAEGTDEQYDDLFISLLDDTNYAEYAKKYAERLKELSGSNSGSGNNRYKRVFEIE